VSSVGLTAGYHSYSRRKETPKMEASPCKHFQTGYCKFREHCRKQHINEMCQEELCTTQTCIKRHPKVCKYFNTHCRFSDRCSYKLVTSRPHDNTGEIVAKITHLENCIREMSLQIIILEKEINLSKKDSQNTSTFKCDACCYEASSETVLKRHKTTKNKQKTNEHSTPERERTSTHNDSLNISSTYEERTEDNSHFLSPQATENIPPISTFKCELCSFESIHSGDLKGHLYLTHNQSIPNTFMLDNHKCHICDEVYNKSVLSKINHMIELHHFMNNTDVCTNCCKPNEVGVYHPESYEAISMICKDCVLI
jgi:hypothetical protein